MERDVVMALSPIISCYFNSHAHVERDQFFHVVKTNLWHFNSHAHVERDYSGFATGTNYQDFNSHAHVERDIDIII